ncbi:DUF4235 domain-containing protein [Streptomyces sp. NRRL S-87]|uniref:DUF4235 domain-containing protein n=1 Tax=Streptomyces sp. NRRL S-87 TaxID=1463920 RepID=UPI0004C1FEB3|nr:DUF4235 domain-containing protein [Streptomyces sp. NRRL S-87]
MNKAKLVYRPVGLGIGAVSGMVASALFKQLWPVFGRGDDAPDALDESRSWPEVLLAAGLQGVVFAVVRAGVDRAGAVGVRKLTGTWPG